MLNQSFCFHRKVFDDGNSLVEVFPSEMKDIMAACADMQRHSVRKVQMVVAASHWSHQLTSLMSQYTTHATVVFTCAIETFIKAEGELVSVSFGTPHLVLVVHIYRCQTKSTNVMLPSYLLQPYTGTIVHRTQCRQ